MRNLTIIGSVVCALLAFPQQGAAEGPSWASAVSCSPNAAADPASPRSPKTPRSPLFDDSQRELTAYGHSLRLVGNKAHTRFPAYTYLAFTFDDGPSYINTPKILDALERYNIPATFFVNGRHIVGKNPGTLKNIVTLQDAVRRGFHIGNHTFNHINLKAVSPRRFKREIERSAAAIERASGYRPYLVRFPYGVIAQKLRNYLDQEGYVEVRWNIDSSDYKLHNRTLLRRRTLAKILSWNGGVLLFHDPKPWTAAVIGGILDDLEALNCKRLRKSEQLILPVSLHYYAREKNGAPRPVPAEVRSRTQRYLAQLPDRCKARIDKKLASQ